MLENVNYWGKSYRGEEVVHLRINVGYKEGEVRVYVGDDMPGKVELFDMLVREGKLGKLSYEDFLEEVNLVMGEGALKEMYYRCVEIDEELSRLFGDYESLWDTDVEPVGIY